MKKNNLFKAVGIVILIYVLFTWIVPIIYSIAGWSTELVSLSGEEISIAQQIGITSIFNVVLETFTGFGALILFILLVGAFYGVLKVTGAYDTLMNFLSEKATGKEKLTLILIIVCMAFISSVAGLDLGLLVLFPILIGFIVKIGYDKLVALSATLGATIIGMYGATFAGTLYGANTTILQVSKYSYIVPKIIFFVVGLAALLFFVISYCRKKKIIFNKETSKKTVKSTGKKDTKKVKLSETKKNVNKKEGKVKSVKKDKKEKKERGALPALIIVGMLLLIILLGTVNWEGIFGSNWFSKAHDSWTGFTIGGFAILGKLFGGVDAFGTWFAPTRFQNYSLLLILAMIAIMICYRTKISDAFEGFVDGIKSFVVPAILAVVACSVFVFVYYYKTIDPITLKLLPSDFNIALSGLFTIINSVFYVDYYYLAYAVLYGISGKYTDANELAILSVMFVNLYSLVMLVAPTSVLLLVSLSISEVKYTEWLKFIWKLAILLFFVSFAVFMFMFSNIVSAIIISVIAVVVFVLFAFSKK